MNKSTISLVLLTSLLVTTSNAMTSFRLEVPTQFRLETAFDKLSVGNICRVSMFGAAIGMFFKAGDLWAKSALHTAPAEGDGTLVRQGRTRASLRYLIAGSILTAAGFLQKYGSKILQQLPKLKLRIFGA